MEMLTSLTPGVGYSNGNGISVKTKTSNIISTDINVAHCSRYGAIVLLYSEIAVHVVMPKQF